MIAANFRKHPEAMALQLVLIFGRCIWHTSRPTQRIARAVRAARAALIRETPQIVRWQRKPVPDWWKEAQRAKKALATAVRASLMPFVWDEAPRRRKGSEWVQLVLQEAMYGTGLHS